MHCDLNEGKPGSLISNESHCTKFYVDWVTQTEDKEFHYMSVFFSESEC
jgi:hypothetical protein